MGHEVIGTSRSRTPGEAHSHQGDSPRLWFSDLEVKGYQHSGQYLTFKGGARNLDEARREQGLDQR